MWVGTICCTEHTFALLKPAASSCFFFFPPSPSPPPQVVGMTLGTPLAAPCHGQDCPVRVTVRATGRRATETAQRQAEDIHRSWGGRRARAGGKGSLGSHGCAAGACVTSAGTLPGRGERESAPGRTLYLLFSKRKEERRKSLCTTSIPRRVCPSCICRHSPLTRHIAAVRALMATRLEDTPGKQACCPPQASLCHSVRQ